MAVVSNAGPLISLARIERLDLLHSLYLEVTLPTAVHREMTQEKNLPGAEIVRESDWVHVVKVQNQNEVQRLLFWLDRGESEAIVLAQELSATLLIDERRGRSIAAALGIPRTGTIGVLIAAKQAGLIELVTPLLDALLNGGVHISERLYVEAQRLTGEFTE